MTTRDARAWLLLLALAACTPSTASRVHDRGSTPSLTSDPAPPADAAADAPDTADAAADAAPAPPPEPADAAPPPPAPAPDAGLVADNNVAPTQGEELTARARGLFEAIVKDEPARGEGFWFPREPFVPLKDVKEPGKYWDQLHRAYVNDIHKLHKARKSWDGAEMIAFDGWSRSKWVPPGDEANKIGYHRAFHGKIRYRVDGVEDSVDVHTIITWQGRWYVTHLRKLRK
jgi:hypothetical protein